MADRDANPLTNTRARRSIAGPHVLHQPGDRAASRQDPDRPSGRDAAAVAAAAAGLMRGGSGLTPEPNMPASRSSGDMVDFVSKSKIPRLSLPGEQDLNRHQSKSSSVLRPPRPKSSAGGFLLSDPALDDLRRESTSSSLRRHRRTSHDARKSSRLPSPQTSDKPTSRGASFSDALHGSFSTSDQDDAIHSGRHSSPNPTGRMSTVPPPAGESSKPKALLTASTSPRLASASTRPASAMASSYLDADSAQIVNMALNLSEKRRLAVRRNTSQLLPPRLSPLPDSTTTSVAGGGLKQHLQQQRRVSRALSPRPDRPPSRLPVAVLPQRTPSSPTQSPFDHGPHDGTSTRFHFSKSTLARARKAKDYMELFGQYRRLLDLVPSLTHPSPSHGRPFATSLSGSPIDGRRSSEYSVSDGADTRLGRPYNPLQYIRNRRVRARERKTINGEEQGFADIDRVTEWVNEAEASASASQEYQTAEATTSLPLFATADELLQTGSPPSSRSRPVATGKPKWPRMDWTIDPADMIADLYWLEQGDNKKMLEDRHWTRVFPQDEDVIRPISRQQTTPQHCSPASTKETLHTRSSADFKRTRSSDMTAGGSDVESVPMSAHDRTHQKLRALKSIHHHRASGSLGRGRDLLRIRRSEVSDSSDTDSERRLGRTRTGTISSSGQDLMHKQMMDMLAKEQREAAELSLPLDKPETHPMMSGAVVANPVSMTPPREKPQPSSQMLGRTSSAHRRTNSRPIETGERENMKSVSPPQQAPVDRGRASLEVPDAGPWQRHSADPYDSSQPTSPEMRPIRGGEGIIGAVPAIGNVNITPGSSRPVSPARKPFHRMKEILTGERSGRDHAAEPSAQARHSEERGRPDYTALIVASPAHENPGMRFPSPERRPSRSPVRKTTTRGIDLSLTSSQKTAARESSKHRRGDDKDGSISSIMGLRSVLRAPNRIDNAFRSGVSKVGDLLWRGGNGGSKDLGQFSEEQEATEDSDASFSEQADAERRDPSVRGRPASVSRQSASRIRSATRSRSPTAQSQGGRHFLDIMPLFRPVSQDGVKRAGAGEPGFLTALAPGSTSPSRKPSRFDLLKPPPLDVKVAGDSSTTESMSPSSPPPELQPTTGRFSRGAASSDPSDNTARAELIRRGVEGDRMSISEALQAAAADASLKNAMLSPVDIASNFPPSASNGGLKISTSIGQNSSKADRSSSSISVPAPGLWSRREMARVRTLILSTGIQAMEMERRSREYQLLLTPPPSSCGTSTADTTPSWTSCHLAEGRELAASVQQAAAVWHSRVEALEGTELPALQARMDAVRVRVEGTAAAAATDAITHAAVSNNKHEPFSHGDDNDNDDDDDSSSKTQEEDEEDSDADVDRDSLDERLGLAGRARRAAELADEALAPDTATSAGAVRLGAKRAGDAIEALLRRRRRRFRWARRAGWLAVEWVLIGCMWYVWFVVMMARVAMGTVGALVAAVRWLLWM